MAAKINFGSDEEFIKNYKELKSSRKMAELYRCSKGPVLKHAKDIGFDVNSVQTPKLFEEDKKRIVSLYNEKTSTELAAEYNVSRGMITKLWYDAGLKGKETIKAPKYDLTNQRFTRLVALYPTEERDIHGSIKWMCQCDCGKKKTISAYDLKSEKIKSCGLCGAKSHGNIKIDNILTEANIPFEREKRFNSCKDKTTLPFDFYVNDQYLIEYDGDYHFNKNRGIYNTEDAQKHDAIKTQWCKDNNIPLIRIPYTEYNKLCLEDLLLETSNFIIK